MHVEAEDSIEDDRTGLGDDERGPDGCRVLVLYPSMFSKFTVFFLHPFSYIFARYYFIFVVSTFSYPIHLVFDNLLIVPSQKCYFLPVVIPSVM